MNAIQEVDHNTGSFKPTNDKVYSTDQVIDAYIQGKKDGLKQTQKLLYNKLIENINKSGEYTKDVLRYLKGRGIEYKDTYLNPISWDEFEILITVIEKDFLSDNILSIYDYLSTVEENSSEDVYDLQFNICAHTDHFDEKCVNADGFIFKFNGK